MGTHIFPTRTGPARGCIRDENAIYAPSPLCVRKVHTAYLHNFNYLRSLVGISVTKHHGHRGRGFALQWRPLEQQSRADRLHCAINEIERIDECSNNNDTDTINIKHDATAPNVFIDYLRARENALFRQSIIAYIRTSNNVHSCISMQLIVVCVRVPALPLLIPSVCLRV